MNRRPEIVDAGLGPTDARRQPAEMRGCGGRLPSAPVIGLIVNPNSRRNRRHLPDLIQVAGRCPDIHHRIAARDSDVPGMLAEFAAMSVNVLAISGGDGTVSRVLTHLLEERPFAAPPCIAVLRGGTANMTAGDVGLHGSAHSALQRLSDWVRHGAGDAKVLRRPILRVSAGGNRPTRYGMFFGAGAIVQGIEYTNANIHSRGLKDEFSLGLGLIRSMWGIAREDSRFIQPADISIGIDGDSPAPPRPVVLLLVSSLERLFLNMHPYWGEDNGKPLHTTMVNSPATRLLRNLPSLLRGKPNRDLARDSAYVSRNVERLYLDFDGPFTLDGEIEHAHREAGPVEVSNGGELSFIGIDHR
ncbi:MAG: diacylglycerol/lipid kinase family protein [Gammaproteobacteria bacterium]